MLAITYKPFETVIGVMSQDFISDLTPSIVKVMFDAEIEADDYLVKAVHAILVSQDKAITEAWVEDNAENREQLFSIIQRQCELHKVIDRLGESLAERFAKLAQMMGVEVDLPTLKRLWKQVSVKFSDRITQISSTAANAIGLSTESTLRTTIRPNGLDVEPVDQEPIGQVQRPE